MKSDSNPLFILGTPRSGTKLLMNLMNNHDQIVLANEFESHIYILRKWHHKNIKENFNNIYEDLIDNYYYLEINRCKNINISKNDIKSRLKKYDIFEILEVFLRLTASLENPEKYNAKIYGQKSINLMKSPKGINFYYPKSKLIHIVRDVRNCSLSSYKAWNTNIFRYSQRWYDDVNNLEIFFKKISKDRKLTLKYEDLIEDPQNQLEKICQFLNIKFSNKMNIVNQNVENLGDAKGARSIINQSNKKYLNFFSNNEIKKIESITFPMLNKFKYDYNYSGFLKGIPVSVLFFYKICDFINKTLFTIKELGILKLFYILKIRILSQIKK